MYMSARRANAVDGLSGPRLRFEATAAASMQVSMDGASRGSGGLQRPWWLFLRVCVRVQQPQHCIYYTSEMSVRVSLARGQKCQTDGDCDVCCVPPSAWISPLALAEICPLLLYFFSPLVVAFWPPLPSALI